MKIRPPAIAGCDRTAVTAPRLNAHLSFSFGTSAAVSFAEAASTNRELVRLGLQPFHCGELASSRNSAPPLQVGVTAASLLVLQPATCPLFPFTTLFRSGQPPRPP